MEFVNVALRLIIVVFMMVILKNTFEYFYALLHTPIVDLTDEMQENIRKNGVLHFTTKENAENILKIGILPNRKRAMCKSEEGLIWFYPNDESKFQDELDIIHIKRDLANCFVKVENFSDEQLHAMHYRPSDGAIAYRGSLRTDTMSIHDIPKG